MKYWKVSLEKERPYYLRDTIAIKTCLFSFEYAYCNVNLVFIFCLYPSSFQLLLMVYADGQL